MTDMAVILLQGNMSPHARCIYKIKALIWDNQKQDDFIHYRLQLRRKSVPIIIMDSGILRVELSSPKFRRHLMILYVISNSNYEFLLSELWN